MKRDPQRMNQGQRGKQEDVRGVKQMFVWPKSPIRISKGTTVVFCFTFLY